MGLGELADKLSAGIHQSNYFGFGFMLLVLGSRGGVVVRALAFRQCGSGSIPGLGVIRREKEKELSFPFPRATHACPISLLPSPF